MMSTGSDWSAAVARRRTRNILATQFGHVEVEQQEIGHDGAQRVQGLATRVRFEHPKAGFRQGVRPELADEGVIVGDQNPLGRGPVLAHGLRGAHPIDGPSAPERERPRAGLRSPGVGPLLRGVAVSGRSR
jgi:hypothetical protein